MFSDRFRIARLLITILTLLTFSSCSAYRPILLSSSKSQSNSPGAAIDTDAMGARVRVLTADEQILSGRMLAMGEGWVLIESGGERLRLEHSEIQGIWIEDGQSPFRTMLLVGVLIFGAGLVLFATFIESLSGDI